ncbi:MAG: DUF86 domain-containing protein [Oscillospiraceae bacterium]|nr:DUF86 domain-containing protein [Oscillospiraceae bacterium]
MAKDCKELLIKHLNALSGILDKYNINTAKDYTKQYKKGYEEFNASTIFHIGHIGENIKKLDDSFKDLDKSIRWKQLIRLRDIAFHDYDSINTDFVADLLFKDIPKLQALLEK